MRPQSITILCVILFLIGFSLAFRSIGQFILSPGLYTFFMLIVSVAGLYCYYGLWNMKRWSIPLFFLVWGIITIPFFLGGDQFSTVTLIRSLYLVAVIAIFSIIVWPQRHNFSDGLVWPLERFNQ